MGGFVIVNPRNESPGYRVRAIVSASSRQKAETPTFPPDLVIKLYRLSIAKYNFLVFGKNAFNFLCRCTGLTSLTS
jgi:hypothetical protein